MRVRRILTSRSDAHPRLWGTRRCWGRRRGSIYIIILTSSALVAAVGLSIIALSRIQFRASRGRNEVTEAEVLAYSAVQHATKLIAAVPNWRDVHVSGVEIPPLPLGKGMFSWMLVDPEDGDLSNHPPGPVRVIGIGRVGDAVRACGVTLSGSDPLEALNTCLHAGNRVYVRSGKMITVVGAPLSTNGDLRNEGTVNGDVEAATISIPGMITGTTTVPAPPKGIPPSTLFNLYRNKATPIPYPGQIDGQVLSPGHNPWGPPNPDGVYFIDTRGGDLTIQRSRIHGTLVVDCRYGKVILDNSALLHSYRRDYPVLIVYGELRIRLKSATEPFREDQSANMNPPGAPYNGDSDGDTTDIYPNEVQGLVHVTGRFEMRETARVRGVILCGGTAELDDSTKIIHDPSIYQNPPEGYAKAVGTMIILPDSWSMEPAP